MYDTRDLVKKSKHMVSAKLVGKVEVGDNSYEVVQVLKLKFDKTMLQEEVDASICDYDEEGILSVTSHVECRDQNEWLVVVVNTY
jgi:hypothetical protein